MRGRLGEEESWEVLEDTNAEASQSRRISLVDALGLQRDEAAGVQGLTQPETTSGKITKTLT